MCSAFHMTQTVGGWWALQDPRLLLAAFTTLTTRQRSAPLPPHQIHQPRAVVKAHVIVFSISRFDAVGVNNWLSTTRSSVGLAGRVPVVTR